MKDLRMKAGGIMLLLKRTIRMAALYGEEKGLMHDDLIQDTENLIMILLQKYAHSGKTAGIILLMEKETKISKGRLLNMPM